MSLKEEQCEWGYFLFEKIEIEVQLSSPGCPFPATWEWLDVIVQLLDDEGDQQATQEHTSTACTFPIRVKDNQLSVALKDIPVHDGQLKTQPSRKQGSEISCLLGMLQFCEDVVNIQKMQVLLWDDKFASVTITADFPFLTQGEVGRRAIYNGSSRLHPATQALLASVRSDWKYLEMFTQELVNLKDALKDNMQKRTLRVKETLMPAKFNLEEVYQQINDSPIEKEILKRRTGIKQQSTTGLTHISADIWTDHISPFLDAKTLHALRQSCFQLHVVLHAVVPGLKLRLFQHQKRSLSWMRSRESRIQHESDLCCKNRSRLFSVEGDDYRAASGGVATLLEHRATGEQIRISQLSGRECDATIAQMNRTVARGGLLCDDPGLGKTITVLSLILQTAGMLPDLPRITKVVKAGGNDKLFNAYWKEQYSVFENRRVALLKLTNSFLRSETVHTSFAPVKKLQKLAEQNYGSCQEFQDAFERLLKASYEDVVLADKVIQRFREAILVFKTNIVEQATKSFTSVTSKPNSAVAALVAETRRLKFLKSLLPSKATLLVVPAVLMDHWEEQIRLHIDFKFLSAKMPMIFNFGEKMKMELDEAKRLFQSTHNALVFLDRGGTKPLPSREFLAGFQIVITTIQRFSNEWKNGSFEQDVRRSESNDVPGYIDGHEPSAKPVSSLLKIYWHRMVIDEGHSMAKGQENSSIQFASWIRAERRWAMTGTPTKHTTMQLNQVKALMRFLHQDFFFSKGDGDQFWKNQIIDRWKRRDLVSFYRLRSLLMLLMRRHTKLDIEELPFPSFAKEIIPMSETEVNTYNTLVSAVQSNILLTSMVGKTSGKQDSLLHRSNARHSREALENVRRVCIGWSRVVPVLSDKHWRETIELAELHNLDLVPVREFMHAAESEGLSYCSICHLGLTTLLLPPCCGKLICKECFDNECTICIACGNDFDVDDFQRLQPGFEMTWRSNLKDPQHINHLEALNHHLFPRPIHADARLENGIHIANPTSHRRTNKFGDGHICVYRDKESMSYAPNHRCVLCWEEHNACNFMNENRLCEICGRTAMDCPEEESKSYNLIEKMTALYKSRDASKERPLKVIVFSQFRKALNVVGDRLYRRFGAACVAEYWGRYRKQELSKFIHDSNCLCLLLTKDGSEGLDLSFVTHIFLLEEIWDKALEEQVVARAWRMGARSRVQVETLVAQHSVEEIMTDVTKEEELKEEITSVQDTERTKLHSLLKALRLVTDYQRLGNGKPKASCGRANALSFDGPATSKKRKHIDVGTGRSLDPPSSDTARNKRVTFHLPL